MTDWEASRGQLSGLHVPPPPELCLLTVELYVRVCWLKGRGGKGPPRDRDPLGKPCRLTVPGPPLSHARAVAQSEVSPTALV